MRCSHCQAWVTPDLATCPKCDRAIDLGAVKPGESLFDRVSKKLDRELADVGPHGFPKSPANMARDARLGAMAARLEENQMAWFEGEEAAWTPLPEAGAATVAASSVLASGPGLAAPGAIGGVRTATIEAEPIGVVNLLLLNFSAPLFRRLAITLPPGERDGAVLRIACTPAFLHPLEIDLPAADAGGTPFTPPPATPDLARFFTLDETARGQLDLSVSRRGELLTQRSYPVVVQSGNLWIEAEGIENALAGVVTPNAAPVIDLMSAVLGELSGYQSSVEGQVAQLGALYRRFCEAGLDYLNPPPSFESLGQGVRHSQRILFPDEVLTHRRGCCIDFATLMAAMVERAGMNPLVLVIRKPPIANAPGYGHAICAAYVGGLEGRLGILRDAAPLRQLEEEKGLVVWDSTSFTQPGAKDFATACAAGRQHFQYLDYAIDIAACRKQGIRPLARGTS